jgi:hypothetical protein
MSQGKISQRITIWLGNDELTADGYGFDVDTEDDMVAISGDLNDQERMEVFIQPDLFPKIRHAMDIIENRKTGKKGR